MKLLSIASGSSGNCIYVGNDNTHILIDVGISGKRVEAGLATIGLQAGDLDAIFITHEHIDHIGGLGVISRKCQVPIYATLGTINGIKRTRSVGFISENLYNPFQKDEILEIGGLHIRPLPISHDAADPVAYRVTDGDKNIAILTDLGYFSEETVNHLQGMNALLLEANHDVGMLQVGPYPYPLKRRILGDAGHLSNENAGRLLSKIVHEKLQYIILGHLSKENNMPELAYEAVRLEITMGDNPFKAEDFCISVAKRSEPSEVIQI